MAPLFVTFLLFAFVPSSPFGAAKTRHRRHFPHAEHSEYLWKQFFPVEKHAKIEKIINNCCREIGPEDCISELFTRHNEDPKAIVELMKREEARKLIKCAQDNFHGTESTDIYRQHCCQLFYNIDTTLISTCSKMCERGMSDPGLKWAELKGKMENECAGKGQFRFQQFVNCVKPDKKSCQETGRNNGQRGAAEEEQGEDGVTGYDDQMNE